MAKGATELSMRPLYCSKIVSRVLFRFEIIETYLSFILDSNHLLALATYPLRQPKHLNEPFKNRSLHGFTTHKVCLALNVAIQSVVSYTAISPFPLPIKIGWGSLFSEALSVTTQLLCCTFLLGSMLLYVARTFLSKINLERQNILLMQT